MLNKNNWSFSDVLQMCSIVLTVFSIGYGIGLRFWDDRITELKDVKVEISKLQTYNEELKMKLENANSHISTLKWENAQLANNIPKSQYDSVLNQIKNTVPIQQYNELNTKYQKTLSDLNNKKACQAELDSNKRQLSDINGKLLQRNCSNGIFTNCIFENQRSVYNNQKATVEKLVSDLSQKCFN